MPAVLVECGFMSNPADREALVSEKGKERIASDLYDAFRNYKKEYDGGDSPGNLPLKQEQAPETKEDIDNGTAFYATQILVSSKEMSPDDPFFKGNEVKVYPAGRFFKYITGWSADPEEARTKRETLKKSFPDSFLVKVDNGVFSRVN